MSDLRAAVEEALSLSHAILPQTIDDVIAIVREHDAPAIEARVRQVAADAWDETAEEAYGCGWLHDLALADVKGRNPYRKDEDE